MERWVTPALSLVLGLLAAVWFLLPAPCGTAAMRSRRAGDTTSPADSS